MKLNSFFLTILMISLPAFLSGTSTSLPDNLNPEKFFGFKPGSDGNLFNYEQVIDYYKALDEASGKVRMTCSIWVAIRPDSSREVSGSMTVEAMMEPSSRGGTNSLPMIE